MTAGPMAGALAAVMLAAAACRGASRDPPPTVHIAGFGALTGPVRAFGLGSRAALRAAADSINRAGGVRLAGGVTARLVVSYRDDGCDPAAGLAVLRRLAASDALLAVGPSCSSVAEPLFRALGRDTAEGAPGLAIPVFTDGATQADLARLSPWAFRNVPDERAMYGALWRLVRRRYPHARTVAGGSEADFAHSRSTWARIIKPAALVEGLEVVAETSWSLNDTTFRRPAEALHRARADVIVLSAHSETTCGLLRELRRLRAGPGLVVGLSSTASGETLRRCGPEAEGLMIPTSFAPLAPPSRAAARAVERAGGDPNLHSMAAWEIVFAVRGLLESAGVRGRRETLDADRRRLRAALAASIRLPGLLGAVGRTREGEARKPFLVVQARGGRWEPLETAVGW